MSTPATYPKVEGTQEEEDKEEMGQGGGTRRRVDAKQGAG